MIRKTTPPRGTSSGHHGEEDSDVRASAVRLFGGAIGDLLASRMWALLALVPLAVGAMLLSSAWKYHAGLNAHAEQIQTLRAAGAGRVVSAWWELDARGARVDEHNWLRSIRPSLCQRIEVAQPGPPVLSQHCRRWKTGFREPYGLIVRATVGGHNWMVGAGFPPELDLRWDPALLEQLETLPAHFWHGPDWGRDQTPLDGLYSWFDTPLQLLMAAHRSESIPLRFDPLDPTRALPVAFIHDASDELNAPPRWLMGGMGAAFWAIGLSILLNNVRRFVLVLVFFGSVLAVPWWEGHVRRLFDSIVSGAGDVVDRVAEELFQLPPNIEFGRDDAPVGAEWVRRPWRMADSSFAPLLERFSPTLPPSPGDEASLGDLLSAELADHLLTLADEDLAARMQTVLDALGGRSHGSRVLLLEISRRLIERAEDYPNASRVAARFLQSEASEPRR